MHAVSNFIRDKINIFEFQKEGKILVQSMGVDTERFRPSCKTYRAQRPYNLVFSGNVVKEKGWRRAFDVVRELNMRDVDCRLHVFGRGPETRGCGWLDHK